MELHPNYMLRAARIAARMSAAELAEAAKCSVDIIWRMERVGPAKMPAGTYAAVLAALAKAGVTIESGAIKVSKKRK